MDSPRARLPACASRSLGLGDVIASSTFATMGKPERQRKRRSETVIGFGHAPLPADLISPDHRALVLRDLEQVLGLDRGSVIWPEHEDDLQMWARWAQYYAALMKRPCLGDQLLASAIAERLRAVLPEGVEVVVTASLIQVNGSQGTMFSQVGIPLRLPIPPDARLELLLRTFAQRLGEFVAGISGQPWPAPHATAHAVVDRHEARICWHVPGEVDPVLSLRPLRRHDFGV